MLLLYSDMFCVISLFREEIFCVTSLCILSMEAENFSSISRKDSVRSVKFSIEFSAMLFSIIVSADSISTWLLFPASSNFKIKLPISS